MCLDYSRVDTISLKRHPVLDERWLQDIIQTDPSILGLGDVFVRDRERAISGSGRLDLLLQDSEEPRRYEVEIQLGKMDESHIIRTIEYWDLERKRFPSYEHVAVIVAEEITGRFLNVISLLNGTIPLIALQVRAVDLGSGRVGLLFTRVLDTIKAVAEEDDEPREETDRAFWEAKSNKQTVSAVDELHKLVRQFDASLELKYNKFYIGLARSGRPDNFVIFRPQKGVVRIEPRIERSDELNTLIERSGLDMLRYRERSGRYVIRVTLADLKRPEAMETLKQFLSDSFRRAGEE
jgi:hypothetical protein